MYVQNKSKMGLRDLLATIDPASVQRFLLFRGWKVSRVDTDVPFYKFTHPGFPGAELVFSVSREAHFYPLELKILLERLERLYPKLTRDDLLREFLNTEHEIFLLAFDTPDEGLDGLPLAFVNGPLFKSVRTMLASAVRQLAYPDKNYFPPQGLTAATETRALLEGARLTHTREGSFAIAVAFASDQPGVDELFDQEEAYKEQSLARQALFKVHEMLDAVLTGFEHNDPYGFIKDRSINANFCKAVQSLYDAKIENSVRFEFEWSNSPVWKPAPQKFSAPLVVKRDQFAYFGSVAERIEARQTEFSNYIAQVKSLDRDDDSDSGSSGYVKLLVVARDGERAEGSFGVNLDAEQHQIAYEVYNKPPYLVAFSANTEIVNDNIVELRDLRDFQPYES